MSDNEKIIGIDLGTTNSAAAVVQDGRPVLLLVGGQRLLPSVVGVSPEGEILIGAPAWNQWVVAPERTVRSIKRRMGMPITVPMAEHSYSPQEISAFILKEIKQAAESALRHPVHRAVITVPAYFNEPQRQATIESGEIAGLEVERIINEPTASALVYGFGVDEDQYLRVLVYDLGGGTFDVSIIELNYGVVDVLATAGDNYLGGDDFDERLAQLLADEFLEEHQIDLREDHHAWARLLRAAEGVKIQLSSQPYTTINLEYIAQDERGRPLHISREVTRHEFEEQIEDLLERTATSIEQALADANLKAEDIDRVLLVGGSTRIPAVWDLVAQRLGQDPHMEVDPDAVVALGAAVQGGIIAGEEIDAILVDVTPLSLGIEVAEVGVTGYLHTDIFKPLVRRNTTIPVQKSELFTTLHPHQDKIEIKVYQGENPTASENVLLGSFMVEDLEANRLDGLCDVSVDFELDINGILDVTVTERKRGRQVKERLKASRQRLSPAEIARSRARLEHLHEDGREGEAAIELDPSTTALLVRAKGVLSLPDLDGELAARIAGLIADVQRAAANDDEDKKQEYADQLVDLLMEIEV